MSRVLKGIVSALVERFHPLKIVLFGSWANGTPHRDSDVDLLLVMETDAGPFERIREVTRALSPQPVPLDIIVKTPSEITKRLSIGDFFIKDILDNGKVLYEQRTG